MIASGRLSINFFFVQRTTICKYRKYHIFVMQFSPLRRYRYWTLTISYTYQCRSHANDVKSRSPRKHAKPDATMMDPKREKRPFTLTGNARDCSWLLRDRYNKVKNYERRSLACGISVAIPGRIKLRFAFVRPIRAFISRALRYARKQLSRISQERSCRPYRRGRIFQFEARWPANDNDDSWTPTRGLIRFADFQARKARLPAASSIRNKRENSRS